MSAAAAMLLFWTQIAHPEEAVGPVPAPDFSTGDCINADSLALSDLLDSPVVLFFFDAGDAGCFKAYPYLDNWHAKYSADGVHVIGIHSPGYEATRHWRNVVTAVARTILKFPIALDYERETYADYRLEVVPTLILLEPGGNIIKAVSEEPEYSEFEQELQSILRRIEPGVVLPFLFEPGRDKRRKGKYPPPTPKLDLGYASGVIANCDSAGFDQFHRYTDPGDKQVGMVYLDGRWKVGERLITYEEGEAAHIRVVYSGKDVWMLPSFDLNQNVGVYFEQDRSSIRLEVLGNDARNDIMGRSSLIIRYAIPLHMLKNATYGTHELKIMPEEGTVSFEYLFFEGEKWQAEEGK
jgi:peroxiredoxin